MTGASTQDRHIYAIGIGANRPLSRALGPRALVLAALSALDEAPLELLDHSTTLATRPLGPSARTYANAVALVASTLEPLAMLDALQAIERRFGRRRYRRWGARTLDLDLLLWSGGMIGHQRLTVPHPGMRMRTFVLRPLRQIAAQWRDPVTGLTIAQLTARLTRPKPVDRRTRPL